MLAVTYSAVKVVVKTLYGGDNFLWDSVMPQDFPKTVSMNAIKCFFKIHKVDIKFSLPFCTLFDDVRSPKHHSNNFAPMTRLYYEKIDLNRFIHLLPTS